MTRWILRILFMLLLGAATTVGVAWVVAWLWSEESLLFTQYTAGAVGRPQYEWFVNFGDPNPAMTYCGLSLATRLPPPDDISAAVPAWSISHCVPTEGKPIDEYAFGWPCRALLYRVRYGAPPGQVVSDGLRTGARPFADGDEIEETRSLPLRPILPGFIINTIFYTAIWFALLFGFGFTKRTIRKKRGRCIACGYDLQHTSATGCPECGRGRAALSNDPDE